MSNYDNAARLTELTDMGAHELAKRVVELEGREAALAAHVERLKDIFIEGFESTEDHNLDAWEQDAKSFLASTPDHSLTKRDLIKQAEALEGAACAFKIGRLVGLEAGRKSAKVLERTASDLRQQASAL